MKHRLDPALAVETKALVAVAFRNGPIEDLHAGKLCPTCGGRPEYSHVSDDQMKAIMKSAVNKLYSLLWQRARRRRLCGISVPGYDVQHTLG